MLCVCPVRFRVAWPWWRNGLYIGADYKQGTWRASERAEGLGIRTLLERKTAAGLVWEY
jgi:hypothetical protein